MMFSSRALCMLKQFNDKKKIEFKIIKFCLLVYRCMQSMSKQFNATVWGICATKRKDLRINLLDSH